MKKKVNIPTALCTVCITVNTYSTYTVMSTQIKKVNIKSPHFCISLFRNTFSEGVCACVCVHTVTHTQSQSHKSSIKETLL